jgi:mono/diheme cytochrome c family protein
MLIANVPGAEKSSASTKADGVTGQAMAVLRVNCLSCHNDEKKKGGLRLTSRENALKGSDNGPVLVPRKADKSLLTKVLLADSDPHMPPKKQLSEKEIATLHRWIDAGAKWDAKALAENASNTKPIQLGAISRTYHPVLALALSPDEKRLAVARASLIYIHDLSQNQLSSHCPTRRPWGRSPVIGVEPGRSISGGWKFSTDCGVGCSNIKTTTGIHEQPGWPDHWAAFTSNSATLVASDGLPTKSGLVHLLSMEDRTNQFTWPAHKDSIYALCLSADDKRLVTGGADKVIRLWGPVHAERDRQTRSAHWPYPRARI